MRHATATRRPQPVRHPLLATAVVLAGVAGACADDRPTAPRPSADADASAAAAAGTPGGAAAADTARPTTYPSAVRVRGRVLATEWTAGRTIGDTLSGFVPVAGARVTLYRNVLVDGRGVSQRVGEQTTDAAGAFTFEDAPGGPYVLALNVTADRPYGETVTYLMGNAAEVSATIRVWRARPAADSARGP